MTTPEIRQRILAHATKLTQKVVCRVEHRSDLAGMEPEDIEQELLAYVIEHMDRFNSGRGSIEAFTTRLVQNAVAKLIRESNKMSCNPPEGVELQTTCSRRCERTRMVYAFPTNESLWLRYAEIRAEGMRNGDGSSSEMNPPKRNEPSKF